MGNKETTESLRQTVGALEQILEVMPDDLFTLRALYEALLQLEQTEKALDCLGRLDEAAAASQNAGMVEFVYNQYASVADEMPEARERMDRLQEIRLTAGVEENGNDKSDNPAVQESSLEAEMALAWDLLQDEQLSQEEYSGTVHDLTEMSARDLGVPVTVLHILNDRNFSRFERLMTHLSHKSGVPVIPLGRFDEKAEMREIFSAEFMSRSGALPFGEIGGELMLAVLNPFDKQLIRRAEELSGRTCHSYLVTPREYDERLRQIKKALG